MGGEKSLGRPLTFEFLLFPLSPSDRQVRAVGAIVGPHAAGPVTVGKPEVPHRRAVRGQLVRDNHLGMDALGGLSADLSGNRRVSPPNAAVITRNAALSKGGGDGVL